MFFRKPQGLEFSGWVWGGDGDLHVEKNRTPLMFCHPDFWKEKFIVHFQKTGRFLEAPHKWSFFWRKMDEFSFQVWVDCRVPAVRSVFLGRHFFSNSAPEGTRFREWKAPSKKGQKGSRFWERIRPSLELT